MRHASLFSGIGGFDLAARWMGWENIFSCEYDPFCQKVLQHHFPTTTHYGDIRELDGTAWRGKIDILTGGFPCQPFSSAGRRRGTEDDRYLWPEMLRVIRESRPTWIVAENVRGLATWNDGLVLEGVCSDLEANGYEVQPFCIPACAVGAPHRRERLWFIAHRTSEQQERPQRGGNKCGESEISTGNGNSHAANANQPETNAEHEGCSRPCECGRHAVDSREEALRQKDRETSNNEYIRCWQEPWLEAATRLCRVDDGFPRELDGITVPKWRKESLKAYGNAIVPQVAYQVFQAIMSSDNALAPVCRK